MVTDAARKKAEELASVTEWCRAILTFWRESGVSPEMCSSLEDVVAQTLQKEDLRGMRQVAKELVKLTSALSVHEWDKLDDVLRREFGRGLREEVKIEIGKVDRVVKRGKIGSKAEYRLLSTRADEIYADESKKNELENINRLLAAYHEGQE